MNIYKQFFTMTSIVKTARVVALAAVFAFAATAPQTVLATTISSSANLVTSTSNSVSVTSSGSETTTNTNESSNGNTTTNSVSNSGISQFACAITVSDSTVNYGGSTTFSWNSNSYSSFTINGTSVSGSAGSYTVSNITQNTIFQIAGFDNNGNPCAAQIIVTCNPIPVDCRLELVKTVDKSTASLGDEITYTIKVKNIGTTNCTGSGVKIVDEIDDNVEYLRYTITSNMIAGYDSGSIVYDVYESGSHTLYFNGDVLTPGESGTIVWVGKVKTPSQCGDFTITNQAKVTAFELNNFLTWVRSNTVSTAIDYDCPNPSVPSCDSFTASPTTILVNNSATLTWDTTNATRVAINNGIGNVALDGSVSVTPLVATTYVLSVYDGNNLLSDTCSVTVNVSEDPVPVCKSFTASPSALPVGGGNVTLTWDVENASSVTISPTVGSVNVTGSTVLGVTQATTYVLTATDSNGDQTTCSAPVTVANPEIFTCAANVSFTANDYSISRGQSITLNWNVTGADSVSISSIGATSLTGSQSVSPSSNTTYTLTAVKNGVSINCPVSISVSTGGGGGGGSSSPRCDLDISKQKIDRGEEVTLSWDTSRAREIKLVDDRGNVLFDTEDMDSDEKDDYEDGEITVRPTRDTEYTLTAERGSRDRTCRVEVDVEDGQVLGVVRDQQPLVAGIALSQVPYTGFEAGPVLTLMFYLLLMAWALYVAYFLVVRRENTVIPSTHFASVSDLNVMPGGATVSGAESMKQAEAIRPDAFAASTVETPVNLPTAEKALGYESYFAGASVTESHADQIITDLENRAHAQRALLSSDAIAYFMTATEGSVDRNEEIDQVIADAKSDYPLEDGWIVINKTRMENLCDSKPKATTVLGESLPVGSGSLAEAIVTGNIVAAYDMIGNRPMFALAEAAADLDSVVRNRKGDSSPISDMLLSETKSLSDEKLQNMITALTGAIDGTYTDEASAVKMAIMKAVKEIA